MKRVLAMIIISGFAFSIFGTLSYLQSCTPQQLMDFRPLAPYHRGCQSLPQGQSHVEMWKLIFVSVISAILLVAIVFRFLAGNLLPHKQSLRFTPVRLAVQRHMKYFDPLIEAFSAGRIQHGSTAR